MERGMSDEHQQTGSATGDLLDEPGGYTMFDFMRRVPASAIPEFVKAVIEADEDPLPIKRRAGQSGGLDGSKAG